MSTARMDGATPICHPPQLESVNESPAELLVRLAHDHPGELTLVPNAPLTNVAAALTLDPTIAQLYY